MKQMEKMMGQMMGPKKGGSRRKKKGRGGGGGGLGEFESMMNKMAD